MRNQIKIHESAIEILEKINEIDIEITSLEESIRAISGYPPFVRLINENQKNIALLKTERERILRSYRVILIEINQSGQELIREKI